MYLTFWLHSSRKMSYRSCFQTWGTSSQTRMCIRSLGFFMISTSLKGIISGLRRLIYKENMPRRLKESRGRWLSFYELLLFSSHIKNHLKRSTESLHWRRYPMTERRLSFNQERHGIKHLYPTWGQEVSSFRSTASHTTSRDLLQEFRLKSVLLGLTISPQTQWVKREASSS